MGHSVARVRRVYSASVLLFVAAGLAGCSSSQHDAMVPAASDFSHVNVTAKVGAQADYVVANVRDSGTGSLRDAVLRANARGRGIAQISFSVKGVIRLKSDFPKISSRVAIDATTAPGYAGHPAVGLDAAGHAAFDFVAGSDGSKLVGMAIVNASGNGITLEANSIYVNFNYVGLTLSGAASGNFGDGIYVSAQSTKDRIGANPSGASGAVGNVVSGNAGNGIGLYGSSNDTVADNWIGTNVQGKKPVGNGKNGIWITAASNDNEIGGRLFKDSATGDVNDPTGNKGKDTPVFVVPPEGNLVSGNAADGILIDSGSTGNELNGNFVGTEQDGDGAIANGGDGVALSNAPANTLAGCKFRNHPFVYYNVLSGNRGNGVHITNSNDAIVQGNFFGVGANNTTIVANGGDGILIDGSSQNTQVGGVIPLGNVSAGNTKNGIEVAGTAAGFITFNTFGGLLAFKGAAPNGNDGLLITSTGGDQTVRTNVLSGNMNNGLEIGGDASGVTVGPNIVGLSTNGTSLLPNGGDGLLVDGTAHKITIGDYYHSVIPQNTFSGNYGYGLDIIQGAHDNQVFNSYFGTNVLATAAMPNRKGGIFIGKYATRNYVGGASTDSKQPRRNLVSGNTGNGITLGNGSSYSSIIDNWIGLDRKGGSLPNSGKPIVVKPNSVHNKIRGNITS
ncbi:MAG TPA: right-handed parallel beta-helix repeat-containing protein [Candidatus Tumulicola sp.]